MKKLLHLVLCFAIVLLACSPVQAKTKVNKITAKPCSSTISVKCTKLAVGNNIVTVKDASDYRNVKFTAPKDGTYKFVLSGLSCKGVKYPSVVIDLGWGDKREHTAQRFCVIYDDMPFNSVCLLTKSWIKQSPYSVESINKSGVFDKITLKVKMNKGDVAVFAHNLLRTVDEDSLSMSSMKNAVKYNMSIKKVR